MQNVKPKNSKFLDILIEGNEEQIMEFLLKNGKQPKPVCPIMFMKEEPDVRTA